MNFNYQINFNSVLTKIISVMYVNFLERPDLIFIFQDNPDKTEFNRGAASSLGSPGFDLGSVSSGQSEGGKSPLAVDHDSDFYDANSPNPHPSNLYNEDPRNQLCKEMERFQCSENPAWCSIKYYEYNQMLEIFQIR